MNKQQLVDIFDKQAVLYDNKKEGPTQKRWRQHLINQAKGEVLELAVGAGANFPYYPPDVKVTAIDFSRLMVEKAQRAAKNYHINAKFICSDIEEVNFDDQSFDTIISTLSLCSYDNPLMVLNKLNRWCKPDGKILLLEHGISSNVIISAIQKTINPILYSKFGCHHTRNIINLIQESGMQIDKAERYWLNMVYLVQAKPKN